MKRARAKPGKVFVGGLKAEMSDDDIKEAFSQYGTVTEMELPFDKVRSYGRTGLPVSCPAVKYRKSEKLWPVKMPVECKWHRVLNKCMHGSTSDHTCIGLR